MEKTKIKTPFGDWEVSRTGSDYIKRHGGLGEKDAIAVGLGRNDVFRARQTGALYHGTDLSDAVRWADNYIAENFEVEKPVEERLKDAEAEIVTLKAKVAELETDGYKFKVGQRVRLNNSKLTTTIAVRQKSTGGVSQYKRMLNNGGVGSLWWYDRNFTSAE